MMPKFDREGRLNLWLGLAILIVVLVTSVTALVQYRTLADCNRRAIQTLHARDQYTDRLRALADRDQANLDRLVTSAAGASGPLSPEQRHRVLVDYVTEHETVNAERKKARTAQDRSSYPSLDDCD